MFVRSANIYIFELKKKTKKYTPVNLTFLCIKCDFQSVHYMDVLHNNGNNKSMRVFDVNLLNIEFMASLTRFNEYYDQCDEKHRSCGLCSTHRL